MTVKACFRASSVARNMNSKNEIDSITVKFYPVCDGSEFTKQWSKWTPSGVLEMNITNPACFDAFTNGEMYYLDIAPVPKSVV